MDLLDRYLAAVAALLPKAQREDIVAELRDILLNQLEAREAELGRPLKDAEVEAVLKAFGHPIAVAGRFGTPRSLIGPELYPFYMFGVKAALLLAAVVSLLPVVGAVLTGHGDVAHALSRILANFINLGLTLIGALTVFAAATERGWIKLDKSTADWRVADLPRLDRLGQAGWAGAWWRSGSWDLGGWGLPDPGGLGLKTRFEALFELAVTVLFVLWWTGLVAAPWLVASPHGELTLSGNPIWVTLHTPILVWALVQVASSLTAVIRPDWVRARAALEIVCNLGGLAFVAVLWGAGRLVLVSGDLVTPRMERLQTVLDQSFHIALIVAAAIWIAMLARNAWRLVRGVSTPRAATI